MNIHIERTQIVTYGLPVLIILTSVFLALSPLLHNNPGLAMGITYDLTLTAPLVYYFLIRKKKVPPITVVPFFVGGIILASFLLPEHQKYHLDLVKTYLLPVVELSFLSVILYHAFKAVKTFEETRNKTDDFYLLLKESAVKAVGYPRIAKVFASEIAMLYYALFAWKKKQEPENSFTSFKDNGITALLVVIVFILMTETFLVHLLLARWNETVAWVLSLSSLYAAIQITGHLKALRRRPSEVKGGHLFLKYGLFGDMEIDIRTIKRIVLTSNDIIDKSRRVEKLALLKGMESHNVAIYFTEKQEVEKAYGLRKDCDTVLLHIDNSKGFVDFINNALQKGP